MDTLIKKSNVPLKYQIAEFIRQKIHEGYYEPGDQIPTEQELCHLFDVSRMTAVNALNLLQSEGLIERKQGKGSFVRPSRITRNLSKVSGFTEYFEELGIMSSSQLLECTILPVTNHVAEQLHINSGEPIVLVRRLRTVEEVPVALTTSYLLLEIGRPLLSLRKGASISLYRHIQDTMGKTPSPGPILLQPSLLNNSQAKLLGVNAGSAGCITTTTSLVDELPVEAVHTVLRGDKFQFYVDRIDYGKASSSAKGIIL